MLGFATATMFQPAPVKVAMLFISSVVLPVPAAEFVWPLVNISQKELLTVAMLYPTRQPTCVEPVTLPVEYELLTVLPHLLCPTRPPTCVEPATLPVE